mmetsp:Transcript_44387/g.141280  ORF Transcript_44387/g.141280 Transcript_44387/m.141280 type:complete len:223 (+) Transcript_44387:359-1027(+)
MATAEANLIWFMTAAWSAVKRKISADMGRGSPASALLMHMLSTTVRRPTLVDTKKVEACRPFRSVCTPSVSRAVDPSAMMPFAQTLRLSITSCTHDGLPGLEGSRKGSRRTWYPHRASHASAVAHSPTASLVIQWQRPPGTPAAVDAPSARLKNSPLPSREGGGAHRVACGSGGGCSRWRARASGPPIRGTALARRELKRPRRGKKPGRPPARAAAAAIAMA